MAIKNIFWDVDGVLANLNYAYYNFLTNHPKYKPLYGNIKWEDLPKVLPIVPKYGALELKTHPTMGVEMDYDFCHSPEFLPIVRFMTARLRLSKNLISLAISSLQCRQLLTLKPKRSF